jgi:uncharacterized protein DUF3592
MIRWQYYGYFGSNGPPLFIVGVVLMLLSALFVALVAKDVYRLQRLATEGIPTIGTVVEKTLHRANDQGTVDTSYELDYVFATAGGRRLEGSDTVDPTTWDAIVEGAQIPLEYAASRPTIQRIGDRVNPPIGGELVIAAASILGLCGAALAIKALRMPWSAAARAAQTDSNTVLAGSPGPMLMKILAFLLRWVSPLTVSAMVTLFLGAIFLLMGAIFLPTGLVTVHQESLFRRAGETVSGTVLTKSVRRSGQGRVSSTHYDIGYRFITHTGISVQGSDDVRGELWRSIHERESIPILYLADHPHQNRLLANDPGTVPRVISVLGATFLGIGALLSGYFLWGSMRRRRERHARA